jgi:DNA-binding CsgD family transcriptional regulator/hemerythrin
MKTPITGDAEIDEQHSILSEMIERLQEFQDQIKNTCPRPHNCSPNRLNKVCSDHSSQLKAFAVRIAEFLNGHTAYEEKLMELLPRSEPCLAHIDGHKKSHNHINAVMRRLIKHAERSNPRELCDLLIMVSREWLLDHTATYDSDLAQKLEIEEPCGGYDKQLVIMLDTLVFRNRPTHAAFSKEINVALRRATSEARICFARLSTVQRRVFSLIITGKNTPDIAETLGISTNTVKTHRTAIYRKMEVSSLVELIHKANLLHKERPGGAQK